MNGTRTGWTYTLARDGTTENYTAKGKLESVVDRKGIRHILAYSDSTTPASIAPQAGLLIRVTDSFNKALNFTYNSYARINTMTDPAGGQYLYQYDGNNNLISVTYPDTRIKHYHYNEPPYTGNTSLPNALTGITDENSIRFATYYYDAQGRAYKEHHAGEVEEYQIGYSSDGSNSTITDPLGVARVISFTTILGAPRPIAQSQPAGAGCNAASTAAAYDANGNVVRRTDFNGNVTTYTYDLSRNLETQRVEGSGTAQARTTSTQWHPQYRLPTLIAEPGKRTTLTYDSHGNLLSQTEQATGDGNGSQGFNAAPIGPARTWSYTYNDVGQVLTATDPNGNMTSYSYDSQGNLVSVRNAAGHVTSLSNYDANGRARRIVDPNGVTTELTYSPRGWLTSRKVGGELTTYGYDGVGQLTKVTHPDGSFLAYTYDAAHRLTEVADSAGDSIHYTLDAMGNRITEQARDANGMLARQITRAYDALNRLQQITGGGQ